MKREIGRERERRNKKMRDGGEGRFVGREWEGFFEKSFCFLVWKFLDKFGDIRGKFFYRFGIW